MVILIRRVVPIHNGDNTTPAANYGRTIVVRGLFDLEAFVGAVRCRRRRRDTHKKRARFAAKDLKTVGYG